MAEAVTCVRSAWRSKGCASVPSAAPMAARDRASRSSPGTWAASRRTRALTSASDDGSVLTTYGVDGAGAGRWVDGCAVYSGGLAALPVDAPALALAGATPDALALPVDQRVLKAGLAYDALIADGLCLVGLLVGDRVEHIWIDAPAGCVLAPGGTHGNIPCYGWGYWTTRQGIASVTWENVASRRKLAERPVWPTAPGGVHRDLARSVVAQPRRVPDLAPHPPVTTGVPPHLGAVAPFR